MSRTAAIVAGLCLVTSAALAQEVKPPAPPPEREPAATAVRPPDAASDQVRSPDASPRGERRRERVRLRSSHTVDVIAPGEKVETIIGRLRPERPVGVERPGDRNAVRGPDKGKGPGRDGTRPRPGREGGRHPPPEGGRHPGPASLQR